jgi:hypothetical protein
MNTQKHTQGPWKSNFPLITAQGSMALTVAVVLSREDSNARTDSAAKTKTEAMANAQLIAAAPDLLAALQETLVELGEYMKICPNDKALDLAGVIAGVRWALIKAEGNA